MNRKTLIHISDIHGDHALFAHCSGDILVVSGDLSLTGTRSELVDVLDWIHSYPCPVKIIIPGNHDRWAFDNQEEFKTLGLDRCLTVLLDSQHYESGLAFYGFPWITRKSEWNWPAKDSAWAVLSEDEDFERALERIPGTSTVLIAHSPPFGLTDTPSPGSYFSQVQEENAGNSQLRNLIDEGTANFRLYLCGHVHGSNGIQRYGALWVSNAARATHRFILDGDQIVSGEIVHVLEGVTAISGASHSS